SMLRHVDVERAIVESQWAMPRQGRSAIAAQMRNYGRVVGACEALGVRMMFVQPGQWKRFVGLNRKHRLDVGDRRDDPVTLSQSRWKALVVPHARAVPGFVDALPARATKAFTVGAADAVCLALAAVQRLEGFERYRWRFNAPSREGIP